MLDARTIGNYERVVRLHIVPGLGKVTLAKLTPAHVQRFIRDEQAAILAAAEGDRVDIMVVLAHATGLRQSELLGIRWSDVDLDRKLLRFGTQLKRDMSLEGPKTAAGIHARHRHHA